MRRRGCLWGVTGSFGLLLVCCLLVFFVGLPRFQDSVRDELAKELSTQVANQFEAQLPSGVTLQPGEYRVSLATIEQQLVSNTSGNSVNSVRLSGQGNEIVMSIETSGQDIEFRGVPTVNTAGDLELTDMTSNAGAVNYIIPADMIGGVLEKSVNLYLQGQGLHLQDVTVDGDDLVFSVAE